MIPSYKDLEVYLRPFKKAMDSFRKINNFLKEKVYLMASQITRLSRSISAHLIEARAKGKYESEFIQHLIHRLGYCSETENRLSFAGEYQYIGQMTRNKMNDEPDQIGTRLNILYQNGRSYEK